MKIIIVVVYTAAALVALACGLVYTPLKMWSYMASVSCLGHLALAFIVAVRPLVDGGKIAAWYWQGLSALTVAALLLPFSFGQGGGWLLAAVILATFTAVVTFVLSLILRQGGVADDR